MKATVTNVRSLLRSLHIDATSYFSIENGDKAGTVVLTLISSFLYRHDADRIETALEDNFSCAFIRDRRGSLHRIVASSKETANNTSQIEESKTELASNNTSQIEETEIKSEKWCVILLGGSIGDGNRVQTPYESNINKETAQNSAKRRNKQLSKGEKSYYGMKYVAVKESCIGKGKYFNYAIEEPKTELASNNTSQIEENKDNFVIAIEKTPLNVNLNATYNKARETFERFKNYTGDKLFSDGTTLSDHMHIVNTFGKALGLHTVADIHLTKTQKNIAFTLLCEAKDLILNGSHVDAMSALVEAYQRRMDNNPEIEFHMCIDYTDVRRLIKEVCKSYAIKAINKYEGTESAFSWWSGDDRIANHIEFIDYLIELYK